MTNDVEQRLRRIPVPANYLSFDTMLAGVKKNELKNQSYGGVSIPVFYVDVPEEKAKALLSLTWGEFNFHKKTHDDLSFNEIPVDIVDAKATNPLQAIIDKEDLGTIEELIEFLENQNPCYGDIFRERLDGNFNKTETARKIEKPETTTRRWIKNVVSFAEEFIEEKNKL